MLVDEDFSKLAYNSNSEGYLTHQGISFKYLFKNWFKIELEEKRFESYQANDFEKKSQKKFF